MDIHPKSPVGLLMAQLEIKCGQQGEAAREEAKALLLKASGARNYRFPRVLSPEEKQKQQGRFEALKEAK